MSQPKFVSKLTVGSLLIYPTTGESPASKRANEFIVYEVKQAKGTVLERCAERLRTVLPGSPLESVFTGTDTLVPVPGHALKAKDALWVPLLICKALIKEGLGSHVLPVLARVTALPYSSRRSPPGGRPDPKKHYETIQCDTAGPLANPSRITLVDDVVTRGATLIGCATRIKECFPGAEITAFALARVDRITDLKDIKEMISPKIEIIHSNNRGSSAWR